MQEPPLKYSKLFKKLLLPHLPIITQQFKNVPNTNADQRVERKTEKKQQKKSSKH